MAIPAMFAACSQDEFLSEADGSQKNILGTPIKVDFVLNDGSQTRVDWGFENGAKWSEGDQFSLFFHGTTENTAGDGSSNKYVGKSNAIYKRGEDGVFRTPSVTYVGSQIIVFPANKGHVEEGDIEVSILDEQDGSVSLGDRSVFVSDEIKLEKLTGDPEDTKQYAGYDQPIRAEIYPLSSQLALNLKFKMTDKVSEVTVKKVALEIKNSSNNYFAVKGNLYKSSSDDSHTAFKGTAEKNTIAVIMPESTKVTADGETLQAQIALLPVMGTLDENNDKYTILVETNYGTVKVKSAKLVTNNAGKVQTKEGPQELSGHESDELSFHVEMGKTKEWTEDAGYGKRIVRNVEVNMADADINGTEVKSSDELINAYNVYDILGKSDEVNFTLVETEAGGTYFDLTKAAYDEIMGHENVTLEFKSGTDGIRLVNGDDSAFETLPDLSTALSGQSSKTLVLGEGNWTLDVKKDGDAVTMGSVFNKLVNEGTLTLTSTTGSSEMNTDIENQGEIKIGETLELKAKLTQTAAGSLDIPEGKVMTMSKADTQEIKGTVTVGGKLIASGASVEVKFAKGAKVTVKGSLLQTSGGAKINNAGTITLGENGAVIITDNKIGSDEGSIEMNNRDNQVKTDGTNAGYIKLPWTEDTFTPAASDAFNYLILRNNKVDLSKITSEEGSNGVKYFEIPKGTVQVTYTETENQQTFTNIFVKSGATLRVPVGSDIKATNSQIDGAVEVYGEYDGGTKKGDGPVYEFNQ